MTSLVLVRYRADPLFGHLGKICKLLDLFRKAGTGGSSHQYAPMAGRAPGQHVIAPGQHIIAPGQHVIAYNYPPLKPVIQPFDCVPLIYWPFMRCFDIHIAQRINSDSAKLVYLLQHCSPKIRANLEPFAGDVNRGYMQDASL